jgi:hypothetical protein
MAPPQEQTAEKKAEIAAPAPAAAALQQHQQQMAYKKVMKRVPTQSVGASAANTPPPARPPPAFQDCEVVEWTAAYAEEKMQASKVRLERHERESKIAMEDEAQRAQERAAAEKAAAAKRAKEIAEMNSPSKEACEKCGKVDRGPGKRCNCYCDRCDNSMRSCDCSCFTGSCTVALEDGSIRRIDSLQAGDMVFSGQFMEDAGVSRPLYKALWCNCFLVALSQQATPFPLTRGAPGFGQMRKECRNRWHWSTSSQWSWMVGEHRTRTIT